MNTLWLPPAEILEYGVDGELRRVFRIEGAGRPVTQAMIDTFIDLERSRRPTTYASVPRSSWHGIYEDIGIPDRLPAFQSLQVDELGWLWAEVYDVDPSGPSAGWSSIPTAEPMARYARRRAWRFNGSDATPSWACGGTSWRSRTSTAID